MYCFRMHHDLEHYCLVVGNGAMLLFRLHGGVCILDKPEAARVGGFWACFFPPHDYWVGGPPNSSH